MSGVPFLVGGRCRCVLGLDACTGDTKSIAELDVFMLVSDRAANELSEMEGANSPLEKFGIPQWSHNQLTSGFCRTIYTGVHICIQCTWYQSSQWSHWMPSWPCRTARLQILQGYYGWRGPGLVCTSPQGTRSSTVHVCCGRLTVPQKDLLLQSGLAFFGEERYLFPSVGRNMGRKGRNTFLPGRNGRNWE